MPWIRVTKAFDWHPPEKNRRVVLAFKPGTYFVRKPCAEAAIKAGCATLVNRPAAVGHGDSHDAFR